MQSGDAHEHSMQLVAVRIQAVPCCRSAQCNQHEHLKIQEDMLNALSNMEEVMCYPVCFTDQLWHDIERKCCECK